jgi:hypothetical protein
MGIRSAKATTLTERMAAPFRDVYMDYALPVQRLLARFDPSLAGLLQLVVQQSKHNIRYFAAIKSIKSQFLGAGCSFWCQVGWNG